MESPACQHRAGRHTPLIFPDCVNHLSEKMEQPEFLHGLIRQMDVFADAVAMQPDLMRFRFLLPKDILPRLRDLALARKELPECSNRWRGFWKS